MRLVDDQELSRLLRLSGGPDEQVYTTGLWYLRLCQAVLGSRTGKGVLSSPFAALSLQRHKRVLHAINELPHQVGVVNLRDLAPSMGALRSTYQLNLLASEVLASALHLNAEVCLSAPSPRLETALHETGCSVRQLYQS